MYEKVMCLVCNVTSLYTTKNEIITTIYNIFGKAIK